MTDETGPRAVARAARSALLAAVLAGAGVLSSLAATPRPTASTMTRVPVAAQAAQAAAPRAFVPKTPAGRPLALRMPGWQMPPPPAPRPRVDCRVDKCVALTFDDGPVPGTARLLNLLRARGVRATFFVLGSSAEAHPELVRREFVEGHEIGNHTYDHADLRALPGSRADAEMARTQATIRRLTGHGTALFRPPYGGTDRRIAGIARRHHLAQILWAVDPFDWRDRDPSVIQRRVVSSARRGSIILLHDIHSTTVAAVPGIVARLAAKGFVFVTVSELYAGRRLTPGRRYTSR